jgi:hypothetical protein
MKEVTLRIPDDKYSFFMELLKNFEFVTIEEDFEITDEQKDIVRKRIKESDADPSRLLKWDDAKKKLTFKDV